ncbi:MAG: putative metal-dependent hydrolase [Pirellulales bacterium]|nr:putative metal-dependent hydrolase [Pirellulales bacterium]
MNSAPLFPVGEYLPEPGLTAQRREELIAEFAALPARVRACVEHLTDAQLETRYRNWTVRQIVHHLADSHVNAYARLRLALTEDRPTIKPYDESRWAELVDARQGPLAPSLDLLAALHVRTAALWRSLGDEQFERSYLHPEYGHTVTLAEMLAGYAHHGRHHLGQVEWLARREGW